MASELTVSGLMKFLRAATGNYDVLEMPPLSVTPSTVQHIHAELSVLITEVALPLQGLTPGWVMMINRDATNFVEVKTGTAGTVFGKMLPGEFMVLRLGSGAQAPYLIADTDTCLVEYLLIAA